MLVLETSQFVFLLDNENVMKTHLEPKEIERIEQADNKLRDKLLVRLLSHLGCRVSEALGIAVNDIDFDQSTVTIVHLKRRIRLSLIWLVRETSHSLHCYLIVGEML